MASPTRRSSLSGNALPSARTAAGSDDRPQPNMLHPGHDWLHMSLRGAQTVTV